MEEAFDTITLFIIAFAIIATYYYAIAIKQNHRSIWLNVGKIVGVIFWAILYLAITIYSQLNGTLVNANVFVPFVRLAVMYAQFISIFDAFKASHRRIGDHDDR